MAPALVPGAAFAFDSPFGMAWLAPDGRFEQANSALLEILGLEATDLVGCSWQQFTHPEDLAAELLQATQLLSGLREGYRLRKRLLRGDGGSCWADVAMSACRDAAGAVERLLLQAVPIDGVINAQAEREQELERQRTISEHSCELVFCFDAELHLCWCSPAAERLLAGEGATWPDQLRPLLTRRSGRSGIRCLALTGADGQARFYELRSSRLAGGELLVQLRDVDAAERSRRALLRDLQLQAALLAGDATPRLLLEAEAGHRVLAANPAACATLQQAADRLQGLPLAELPGSLQQPWCAALAKALAGGEPASIQHQPEGSTPLQCSFRIEADPGAPGTSEGILLSWRDDSERHYRQLAENATDVVFLIDDQGLIRWVSPSLSRVLGWRPEQWLGSRGTDYLRHGGDCDRYRRNIAAIGQGRTVIACDEIRASDGSWHWIETHAGPYRSDDGTISGAVAFFRLLDRPVVPEPSPAPFLQLDPLTGALRRGALFDALSMKQLGSRRRVDRMGLLLCDVDQLSSLNARHGRQVGDQPLQTIAQRLRGTIRDEDLLCRFGGDEFLVVLQGVSQLEHALAAAGSILEAAHQPLPGMGLTPSLSIGATLVAADEALDAALQRADAATHAAKAGGGHQVVVMAGMARPVGANLGTGTTRSAGRAKER